MQENNRDAILSLRYKDTLKLKVKFLGSMMLSAISD